MKASDQPPPHPPHASHRPPAQVIVSTGQPTVTATTNEDVYVTQWRGQHGMRLLVICPAHTPPGSVWGTDLYTDDSGVCTAAQHAGRLRLRDGGQVMVEMAPGQRHYVGTMRHGITSADYGDWHGSFIFR